MARTFETPLLALTSFAAGAACMYCYFSFKTVEKANVTFATANQELKAAAAGISQQVVTLSEVSARNSKISQGLSQNAILIKKLSGCPLDAELGALYLAQAKAINAARNRSTEGKVHLLPGDKGNKTP